MNEGRINNIAKISDIVDKLSKPEDYVRRVYGNMLAYKNENGAAFVRIGITGKGRAPHYRLQHSRTVVFLLPPDDWDEKRKVEEWKLYYRAFNGTSHEMMNWSDEQLSENNWSGEEMSLEDIKALLGRLREKKK